MAREDSDVGAFLSGFVIGGLVGAAVALILAPQSGEETRTLIRERGIELKERGQAGLDEARARAEQAAAEARTRAEELAQQAKARAEEVRDRGKATLEEQRDRVKAAADALRKSDAGEESEAA